MEIGSMLHSGLSGYRRAEDVVTRSAFEIANLSNPNSETNLTESLVNLKIGEVNAQASARVIETADEVLGTLIDTRV